MPPGTGDEPLSIAQLIPGGMAVIVTTPQDVALPIDEKIVESGDSGNPFVLHYENL